MAAGGTRPPGAGSAPWAAAGGAELRVMAATRLPPGALTLKQVRAGAQAASGPPGAGGSAGRRLRGRGLLRGAAVWQPPS